MRSGLGRWSLHSDNDRGYDGCKIIAAYMQEVVLFLRTWLIGITISITWQFRVLVP